MLDIKYIRENLDAIKLNTKNRNVKVDFDRLLQLDESRRALLTQSEELRAKRNKGSKGKPTPEEIAEMRKVGDEIKVLENDLLGIDTEYLNLLKTVPNLTHSNTPIGGEDDYKVLYTNKDPQNLDFKPKDHEQLMLDLDLIDFERGAKVAEAKAYFAKNQLVKLNHALINYGMDILQKHGFTLLETPDMAKNHILEGIGFSPRGPESQIYNIENTEMSLIGTAEIAVGGYHADEVLDLSKGPLKYAAYSHSFRTEAGAYGRTSKGLYRVHQFGKLEIFVFCKPEESEQMHKEILEIEKEIIDGLEFPYRVIDIASGDLGGPAFKKYDIEAWMTMKGEGDSQGGYGEITSASNCTDYQARRLNTRHKKKDGTSEFVHTLNGTAIALSRFPIAILENFQQADGSVSMPEVLKPYLNFDKISK
jgi:seryl-tRNA synthetase